MLTINRESKPGRKPRRGCWSCSTRPAKHFPAEGKPRKKSHEQSMLTRKTFFTPLPILRATIQACRLREVKDLQGTNSRWNNRRLPRRSDAKAGEVSSDL